MRFKSDLTEGFRVYAVAGTNTISFAIDATPAARKGLLGFWVERFDPVANEHYTMPGFKVFESVIPHPTPHVDVSTHDHPVQSFLWDDFTGKPGQAYQYLFHPLRGTPKNLDRTAAPVIIDVRTEPLYTPNDHDVFFNRGVASSQAYERKFGNKRIDELAPAKQKEALDWLTRDLDDAIIKFIQSCGANDTLLCCFYEFHYMPVLVELAKAAGRIHSLRIIIDAKKNEYTDKKGAFHKSFPREENLDAIKKAGIPAGCIIRREANKDDIQHNKFMVRLEGAAQTPTQVWTGSTNLSDGGVTGQTNVGHWVRDSSIAAAYKSYWDLLQADPGPAAGDDASTGRKKMKDLREAVVALTKAPKVTGEIAKGTTAVFSPRTDLGVLDLYVELVDKAASLACITLAFGVNQLFKDQLKDNTVQDHLTFLLLEEKDKPNTRSNKPFVAINAANNVYKAWGSYIRNPVYQWARETNTRFLELNTHVSYIHSKFLLNDPLGADPIVVSGSANFSDASTKDNDENMIIVRGNRRVADIYFTEFNRLFNHYYFRAVTESAHDSKAEQDAQLFLREKPEEWLKKYEGPTLRTKRLAVYTRMAI